MVPKKKICCAGLTFLMIFLMQTAATGLTINKAVSCPQGINEKDVMDRAINECQKLGYSPEQEGGKLVLTKGYEFSCVGSMGISEVRYKIIPALATGKDGRKVFTLGGEYIGKPMDRGHRGECFECDLDQIEKAVKNYLETK